MSRPVFQLKTLLPSRYSLNSPASRQPSLKVATLIFVSFLVCVWIGVILLTNGLTIGGVPAPIIVSFIQDETARSAYFKGDSKKLHDRLQDMGVEEKIKAFYRPQIGDEVQLDQYIHQLLYNRTGHVGDAYKVNSQGILVLKKKAK
jgi:hypothetical protein